MYHCLHKHRQFDDLSKCYEPAVISVKTKEILILKVVQPFLCLIMVAVI